MEEENSQSQEKTEQPTDDRREKFRKRGEVVFSRELSSASTFIIFIIFMTYLFSQTFESLKNFIETQLSNVYTQQLTTKDFLNLIFSIWKKFIIIIAPFFFVTMSASILTTIFQTQGNISWEKLSFSWNRLNFFSGIKRMFSGRAVVELIKGIAKIILISGISYSVLYGNMTEFPYFMYLSIPQTWLKLFSIVNQFLGLSAFILLIIGIFDYIYLFIQHEKKIMMTKQELKEELKQKEVDPQIKGKIRKIQRDLAERKTLAKTKEATVLITNPTHYSIALKYEFGMPAPVVLGKGMDHLALAMRKIAKELDIPIVENKILARALYREVEEKEEIPSNLYKAVSEIIRYVFTIKGIKVPKKKT